MQALVILCTCPDQEVAGRIAEALVGEKLAACVNILPAVTSVYRWEEGVERDSELLLVIKSHGDAYQALEARIHSLHPYDVPEIIALPIQRGSAEYLAWIEASCS